MQSQWMYAAATVAVVLGTLCVGQSRAQEVPTKAVQVASVDVSVVRDAKGVVTIYLGRDPLATASGLTLHGKFKALLKGSDEPDATSETKPLPLPKDPTPTKPMPPICNPPCITFGSYGPYQLIRFLNKPALQKLP